ncbi:MAG: metal ABC transporter permease [Burkholderiales bacterium]|nr:metal ABC transporter permease [Burkholderiales bacterium]
MNWTAMFEPMFFMPFATGLLVAAVLPILGMYLRLREEWLAALAFAQLAAAGSLAAAIAGAPVLVGGLALSGVAAAAKAWIARNGNNGYAILMVAGWGASVLMLANAPLADHLGHALFDGQLYFTDAHNLWSMAAFALVGGLTMRWLSHKLLFERMFPDFFRASGLSATRYHLLFDLLAAAGLALATASVGVMAAFTLVFVPTMIAYQWGRSWRQSLAIAVVIGVVAYVVAFQIALVQDQPFGPVLVVTMVSAAAGAWALRKLAFRQPARTPAKH